MLSKVLASIWFRAYMHFCILASKDILKEIFFSDFRDLVIGLFGNLAHACPHILCCSLHTGDRLH